MRGAKRHLVGLGGCSQVVLLIRRYLSGPGYQLDASLLPVKSLPIIIVFNEWIPQLHPRAVQGGGSLLVPRSLVSREAPDPVNKTLDLPPNCYLYVQCTRGQMVPSWHWGSLMPSRMFCSVVLASTSVFKDGLSICRENSSERSRFVVITKILLLTPPVTPKFPARARERSSMRRADRA